MPVKSYDISLTCQWLLRSKTVLSQCKIKKKTTYIILY